MSEPLVTTLNVAFNKDDGLGDNAGKNKIVLQQMTKRFDYQGQLRARCFSSQKVQFTASVGTLIQGEVRVENRQEGLKFSNSASASLAVPDIQNVSITPYVLMEKTQDLYGNTRIVSVTDIILRFDSQTETVIAERKGVATPIYGACFVSYQASYQILYYKPKIQAIPVGGGSNAITFKIGSIFGYNDYTVEVLDMELDLSDPPNWVEYARVTSKIVLDAKGVWEFPPNWESTYQGNKKKTGEERSDYPEAGKFPYFTDEIDENNSFVDMRVHEIVEVSTTGTLRYLAQNGSAAIYAPYWGAAASYHPIFEVKFADPPGGKKAGSAQDFIYDLNHTTWNDVFLSVDKAEVLKALEEDYPGVTEA